MDVACIEAWLSLPAFRVIPQVISPQQLAFHLERRDPFIVCPRGQTCCSRVHERRPRCLRAFPMLERPVVLWLPRRRCACSDCRHRPWETSETCGERVQWTDRLDTPVRQAYVPGGPCSALARRDGLAERTGFRWTFESSRGGALASLAEPLALMRMPGARGTATTQ
jgi:hypothetical protein